MSSSTPTPEQVAQRAAFIRNLRLIMARLGLKTRTMAEAVGKPYPWVWRRQTGDVVPDLDDLTILAQALSVSVTDLVSDEEPTSTFIPGGAA